MNFNTMLLRLGFDPDSFVNADNEVIRSEDGFIYELYQKDESRICPYCKKKSLIINDRRSVTINVSETDQIRDLLRIIKIRYRCKNCHKTYTPPIRGIEPYSKIGSQTLQMILNDLHKTIPFSMIAQRYGLSSARVIQIFDDKYSFIPRGHLPEALCIDEIAFSEEINQKYCCILYDFNKREIVDIIKNRQIPYLYEYFDKISESERYNVRYFISDMYDGYRTIQKKYFKRAFHIVDLFHVIRLLTGAVNSIRTETMKKLDHKSAEYHFMKGHWREFLKRKEYISNKSYEPKGYGYSIGYSDLVFRCLLKDKDFLEGYNILQDLYHYNHNETFMDSLKFIDYISERLLLTDNDHLYPVGMSYQKWRIEIASGISSNPSGKHYSNGIAESINNHLKTIIKMSYGYHNFERFRKRALLICRYKKV